MWQNALWGLAILVTLLTLLLAITARKRSLLEELLHEECKEDVRRTVEGQIIVGPLPDKPIRSSRRRDGRHAQGGSAHIGHSSLEERTCADLLREGKRVEEEGRQ